MKNIDEFVSFFGSLEQFLSVGVTPVGDRFWPTFLNVTNGSHVLPNVEDVSSLFGRSKFEFKEGVRVVWSPSRGNYVGEVSNVLMGDECDQYMKVMRTQSDLLR